MGYKPQVWLLFSGGIDSTALIDFFLRQKCSIQPIYVDYGHPSKQKELKAVKQITTYYSLSYSIIKISGLGKINKGEVLGRNAAFICLALMQQKKIQSGLISLGIHGGSLYPDSSMRFTIDMQRTIDLYSDGKIKISCPFIEWQKEDIIDYSLAKKVPLDLTYSCELGLRQPCGKCNSCKDLIKIIPNAKFGKK